MSDLVAQLRLPDPDILRMAFVLGIIASALIYDRLHLTTGSIVVPGYLGVSVLYPILVGATFANAFIVFWVVYKLLPMHFIMGGRAKFLLATSASVALQFLLLKVSGLSGLYWASIPLVGAIGFVIPGLIAHDFARHGMAKTLVTTTVAGSMVALVVGLALLTLGSPGLPDSFPELPQFTFDIQWIGLAIMFSVLAAAGLQYNYGLRAGGFVGSGYVTMVLVSPADIIYLSGLSLATYYLVTRFLMSSQLILFGQRKFAMVMLCSVVLSWGVLNVLERGIGYQGLIASSMPMASVFLPGLFANDMERVGIVRVMIGTTLAVVFTFFAVLLCTEISGEQRIQPMITLGLLTAFVSTFIFVRIVPIRLARLAPRSS